MNYFIGLIRRFIVALTTADFYRTVTKTLWLFFPSFIFLFLCWFAFWKLSQGKDLMIYTLEHPQVYICFFIAILFFAYIVWFSSRLVTKAKFWEDENHLWLIVRVHMPRFLGFSCFTIIILAFLKLQITDASSIKNGWATILMILSFPYYILLHRISNYFVFTKDYQVKGIFASILFIITGSLLSVFFLRSYIGLVIVLMILQLVMVFFFVARRKAIQQEMDKNKTLVQKGDDGKKIYKGKKGIVLLFAKMKRLYRDPEERGSMNFFNPIAGVAIIFYVTTILSVKFSVFIGTFPFVLLAFGVLAGFINFISTLSVFAKFNFHLLFLIIAFITGSIYDPHSVQLIKKQNAQALFNKRQKLQEYFISWVKQRYPNPDSLIKSQPVYFVLADGGASRSGYWVASVLSKLEDSTRADKKFSKNLFCLSGASGGSVGNAAFYNLLLNKKLLVDQNKTYLEVSKEYLGTDFLSFTIAKMLGPDFFRYILPFLITTNDRAYSLTKALEQAPKEKNILYKTMATGFSSIITQTGQSSAMPILCINTTRMQDGRPGVISTIDMTEKFFNKRVDVLSMMDEEKDLKMSSAIVLGASFPYVSPAGRIEGLKKGKKTDGTDSIYSEPNYFVDGGYFDNSGAGVVQEMIIAMRQMMNSDLFLIKYKNKLDFYVLHITNDPNPGGDATLNKVNPLTNDLAAPIRTLAGAYGSQTSVNDSRLKNYLENNFGPGRYIPLNLYRHNDKMSFSMNWVISNRSLDSMNARLEHSDSVNNLLQKMRE